MTAATRSRTRPADLPAGDDANDIIWGAEKIGRAIGLTDRRRAYYLLEHGRLPAKQIGRTWVASRRRLLAHVVG